MNISAVIPTYNYAKYVHRAIDSALDQTYPLAEIIVVDDGSTDNTREVLAKYGDRIRYVYQQNRGLAGARNTGIREARHPWLAFLDSDDWWLPEKIERQARMVEARPELDIVYTALWMVEPDGTKFLREATPPETLWPRLRYVNTVTPSSVLARRQLIVDAGYFDESLRFCEDWELWVRMGPGVKFGAVTEPMVGYQLTPGSLSSKVDLEIQTTERVAEKTLLRGLGGWEKEVWRRRIMSAQFFRASVTCRPLDAARARHYLYRSLRCWPSPAFMPERWKTLAIEGRKAALGR